MPQPAKFRQAIALSLGVCACTGSLALGGCAMDMGGFSFMPSKNMGAEAVLDEPLLGADGRCTGNAAVSPAALQSETIEPGITTECDLVRIKGQPTDVLIGSDRKGRRETQVLYQEPTGKRIFFFSANRLVRSFE